MSDDIKLIIKYYDVCITDPLEPTTLLKKDNRVWELSVDPGTPYHPEFKKKKFAFRSYLISESTLAELCLYYQ